MDTIFRIAVVITWGVTFLAACYRVVPRVWLAKPLTQLDTFVALLGFTGMLMTMYNANTLFLNRDLGVVLGLTAFSALLGLASAMTVVKLLRLEK